MTFGFPSVLLLVGVPLLGSCGPDPAEHNESTAEARESPSATAPPTTAPALGDSGVSDAPVGLVEAAARVVRFLRGEVPFDSIHLADTVSLYLGKEEGRTRRDIAREMLRDRRNWHVRSPSFRHSYSFVPPVGNAVLTTRAGRHLNCLDYPLSATFPELAALPHVGTTLRYGADSCLQTWNLTLVFSGHEEPWKVVGAIYDQFEW